jgi:hypothetical protein
MNARRSPILVPDAVMGIVGVPEGTDQHAKAPLLCRVYRDPRGQPLKTALAKHFPLLSRRERRELMREAIKAQTRVQKAGK